MSKRLRLALVASLCVVLAGALASCGSDSFDDIVTDTDSDGDGIANQEDNCPLDPNPGQTNADADAYGDACDCTYSDESCLIESLQSGNCSNGRDDDGDQLADAADPNCRVERADNANCGDSIDNDGDGLLDCQEASCAGAPGCPGGP